MRKRSEVTIALLIIGGGIMLAISVDGCAPNYEAAALVEGTEQRTDPGINIDEVVLSDGTRCVVAMRYRSARGLAMSCDWGGEAVQ